MEMYIFQNCLDSFFFIIKCRTGNKCEEIVWCDINNLPEDMIDFEVTAINNNLNGIKFSVVYADNEKKLTL